MHHTHLLPISMSKCLKISFFIALCLMPFSSMAQEVTKVEILEVDLWPEYDRSEMLVIIRMQLGDNVPLPVIVELPIPAHIGEPSAVAKWDVIAGPDDRVQWSLIDDDEWNWIAIETDVQGVWLEYYDVLTLDGTDRSYTFQWLGGFEINSMYIKVQQPQAADSMSVSGTTEIVEEDGLLYHIVNAGSLQSSESVRIDISYTNPVGQLTNPAMIVRPDETRGSTPDVSARQPYVIGGLSVLMLILGMVLWLRLRRDVEAGASRRQHGVKGKKDAEPDVGRSARTQRFCHYCGTRANLDDNFCRNCGTKLR